MEFPRQGVWTLVVALLPSLAAVWVVPGFVTQDGPAHVYNAHILAESLRPGSPFAGAFAVRRDPVPNWAGHLVLMGLVSALPARTADRVMMSITMVGLAASIAWLRWRVAGARGASRTALLAALLALNATWLLGFYGFLLGACLFPITLGLWWAGRERLGWGRVAGVAGLLVVGYFCHPVSLALTAFGLVVLAATTPGPEPRRRWLETAAILLVLVPLGLLYRALMRSGGVARPTWGLLSQPWSWRTWGAQLGWVDPLTLGSKTIAPFLEARSVLFILIAPVLWLVAALALVLVPTIRRVGERRGWLVLAGLLVLGGVAGPDSLGPGHGDYLPQRIVLLGLVALVPALRFEGRSGVAAGACLTMAVVAQSAFVWDYARRSDTTAGEVLRMGPHVGQGQRVGTLWVTLRGRYRANPLLHVDCLLGVGTGNVIWTNYEAAYYYFPVRFRDDVPHPPALEFENLSKLDHPADAAERARRWGRLLGACHGQVDRLLTRGADPTLDAITARWFEPTAREGSVRVWRRRSVAVPRSRSPSP